MMVRTITTRRFANEGRRGLQPASAHTSATMRGWDTMAPRWGGIISGCDTSSRARLPAEDAAEAVTRIDAVALDGRVNVGTPSTCSLVHAVHRSVTVTRHICCAACKEATTQNKPYVATYGTRSLHLRRSSAPASAPKQIISSNCATVRRGRTVAHWLRKSLLRTGRDRLDRADQIPA
jgi:hypothetical protein